MILWRISSHADLGGLGGVHRSGRWRSRGVPVVYLSESPALALLEVLVNFEIAPDELHWLVWRCWSTSRVRLMNSRCTTGYWKWIAPKLAPCS
ncbi:MAG: RES family NAD+ phosphorylase [Gammaproteobacteria bacterium]|nr:RES family NAD+ phosphorylase [Gammaproteobacteria bacterium]